MATKVLISLGLAVLGLVILTTWRSARNEALAEATAQLAAGGRPAEVRAAELGVDLLIADANLDVAAQISKAENFMAQQVDVLVLTPVLPPPTQPPLPPPLLRHPPQLPTQRRCWTLVLKLTPAWLLWTNCWPCDHVCAFHTTCFVPVYPVFVKHTHTHTQSFFRHK